MLIHIGGDRYVKSGDIICVLSAAAVSGSSPAAGFIGSLRGRGAVKGETDATASYIITCVNGDTAAAASDISVRTLEKRCGLYSNIGRK